MSQMIRKPRKNQFQVLLKKITKKIYIKTENTNPLIKTLNRIGISTAPPQDDYEGSYQEI